MDVENRLELESFRRVRDAYLILRQKNKNDELLSLAILINNEKGLCFLDAYFKRFVDSRDEFGTFGYDRYTTALELAAAS